MKNNFVNAEHFQDGDEIVVYGYGGKGMEFLRHLESHGKKIHVSCFIDTYKEGEHEGTAVQRLDTIPEEKLRRMKIVVASVFWQEIVKELKVRGCSENVVVYDPDAMDTEYYCDVRVDTAFALFGKKTIGLESAQFESLRKLVLHSSPDFVSGAFSNTVCEQYVDCHSSKAVGGVLESWIPQCDVLVICPKTGDDIVFVHNIVQRVSQDTLIAIAPPRERHARAYILEDLKAIYLPIPKCASTSILGMLKQTYENCTRAHDFSNMDTNVRMIDMNTFDFSRYFTFTFIREPKGRTLSLYKRHFATGKYLYGNIKKHLGAETLSFGDFVNFITTCGDEIAEDHFKSQHQFISDGRGELCVDFIGCLETFDEDWAYVMDKTDLPNIQKKRNVSGAGTSDVQSLYTPELIAKVQSRYAKDFELYQATIEMNACS